jgi:methionyl-tRNA synthetase
MTNITFDDFAKVEMTIGRILTADPVEGSEKLLRLSVDFAEENPRQVISGIARQFPGGEGLAGNSFVFITNLEPRMIMGLESQAMIVAGTVENGLALMSPTLDLPPGTRLS